MTLILTRFDWAMFDCNRIRLGLQSILVLVKCIYRLCNYAWNGESDEHDDHNDVCFVDHNLALVILLSQD